MQLSEPFQVHSNHHKIVELQLKNLMQRKVSAENMKNTISRSHGSKFRKHHYIVNSAELWIMQNKC